jgi:hypothetical protein
MHTHRVLSGTSYHNMIGIPTGQETVAVGPGRITSSNIGRDKSFVDASEGRQRLEEAAGEQSPDLRRPALPRFFREPERGQPGRGAGRDDLPLARRGLRCSSERGWQSGTQERPSQEGP